MKVIVSLKKVEQKLKTFFRPPGFKLFPSFFSPFSPLCLFFFFPFLPFLLPSFLPPFLLAASLPSKPSEWHSALPSSGATRYYKMNRSGLGISATSQNLDLEKKMYGNTTI